MYIFYEINFFLLLIFEYVVFQNKLKKIEAKKFQALADAFKQHDVEREILVQKKVKQNKKVRLLKLKISLNLILIFPWLVSLLLLQIKEYSDLEVMLKNSLSEVEKREKQLAFNETQVSIC